MTSNFFSIGKSRKLSPLIAVLLILAGTLISSRAVAGRWRSSRVEVLSPVPSARGISGRRLVRFPQGKCIVLRHPVIAVNPDKVSPTHNFAEHDELVRYEFPASSRWYVPPDRPELLTTFNCATLAIGEVIGLTTSDWLEPTACCETNNECPVEIVLANFFDQVALYQLSEINWTELESLQTLRDEDVVALVYRASDSVEFVHLGMISKQDGRNQMISKMGPDFIMRGSIHETAMRYAGEFTELQIYRRR